MKPPFERQDSTKMTRHHLLYERPQWEARPVSTRVRQLGAYSVAAVRAPHDYLHFAMRPVTVPGLAVLKTMEEIGHTYNGWTNDETRIEHIIDEIVGYARFTPSAQQCHEALEVAVSLEAQMAVLGLMKEIKPRRR